MGNLIITRPPRGKIVVSGVSEDDYMEYYAEQHHEWVRKYVIKKAPITLTHYELTQYLRDFLIIYFVFKRAEITAKVVGSPFVMRLAEVEARREPDLQVILGANLANLKETYMDGAADICIEVVSPGTLPSTTATSWKNMSGAAWASTGCSIKSGAAPFSIVSRKRAAT
jgi:Uma2 family endonuclease